MANCMESASCYLSSGLIPPKLQGAHLNCWQILSIDSFNLDENYTLSSKHLKENGQGLYTALENRKAENLAQSFQEA